MPLAATVVEASILLLLDAQPALLPKDSSRIDRVDKPLESAKTLVRKAAGGFLGTLIGGAGRVPLVTTVVEASTLLLLDARPALLPKDSSWLDKVEQHLEAKTLVRKAAVVKVVTFIRIQRGDGLHKISDTTEVIIRIIDYVISVFCHRPETELSPVFLR